jgi:hypothetical protein
MRFVNFLLCVNFMICLYAFIEVVISSVIPFAAAATTDEWSYCLKTEEHHADVRKLLRVCHEDIMKPENGDMC